MKYRALLEDDEIAICFLRSIFCTRKEILDKRKADIKRLSKQGLNKKEICKTLNITQGQLYATLARK